MLLFWRFREHRWVLLLLLLCLFCQDLSFCWCLNGEGVALLRIKERVTDDPFGALSNWKYDVAEENPCSWFGVECSNGNVVVLNLKDLCLKGTLAPDVANLVRIESIILRNNSFSGMIPEELAKLKELKMLDLGYNNFSGPLPLDMGDNPALTILLQDNNGLFRSISPETSTLLLKFQASENKLSISTHASLSILPAWDLGTPTLVETETSFAYYSTAEVTGVVAPRKLLQASQTDRPQSKCQRMCAPPASKNLRAPPPSHSSPSPSASSAPHLSPTMNSPTSPPATWLVSPPPLFTRADSQSSSHHQAVILSAAIGGPLLLIILVIIILFARSKKVTVVKPWVTGLSGQLQKAFVTGVPNLKRSEIEAACEDFSNVIGSLAVGTLYKGTLSSGVEIAVVSLPVASAKDWSKNLETQFRKKIDTLSKVNHKNFVNLLGYCEEDYPFTRMIVFEYAPNGTLFEHLHIKEAEHLDWGMRMRIAMGISYALEYMHQLTPPIPHRKLNSSSVYLTEDYAAKVSDFAFSNEVAADDVEPDMQSNVYSFGVVLFEMITGRLPFSVDNGSPENWASDYLKGIKHLRELVDPTLDSFQEQQLDQLGEVIKSCINPASELRPAMREVSARLREITSIGPDAAIPKLSPLWWAELEILSTEIN